MYEPSWRFPGTHLHGKLWAEGCSLAAWVSRYHGNMGEEWDAKAHHAVGKFVTPV